MSSQFIEFAEYKHLECPQSWVNALLNQYSIFFWNLVATQVVVSKESHLERGGMFDTDTIYSVTTTERFATIDLKRRRDIPYLDYIKQYEQRYMQICGNLIDLGCTPLDNYTSPPPVKGIGCLGALWSMSLAGRGYSKKIKATNEQKALQYQQLKTELDNLLISYRQFLTAYGFG